MSPARQRIRVLSGGDATRRALRPISHPPPPPSSPLPEPYGAAHTAAPPLRTFLHVSPLGVLSDVAQGGHYSPERGGVYFGKLEAADEVVLSFASIAVRGVHEATCDAGNTRRSGESMPLGDEFFLCVITRQKKALAMHPIHAPPGRGFILRHDHPQGALPARLRRKSRRIGKLGH